MERCLPVGRVGEDGLSIRVLDHEKKTKRHKQGNNPISTFLPFKTEKNGKDEKVLTRRARGRKRFVNRSLGQQDMSGRAERGEVGSRERKGRRKDEMKKKSRAAHFKVGPRAPSSRAARDDHARVSTSCQHRRKNSIFLFILFYFPRYRPPFGECVCDLYLFSVSRYEFCVCGGELVYACAYEHKFGVATNHGKF